MSIDFAYAQARVQARLGARLPDAGWRVLESTPGLPEYLVSARNTVLAPRLRHFSAAVTPHTIERTLRDDWRAEVAAVGRWVPGPWVPAVAWTAWLPYLAAVAWLLQDEPAPAWMRDDPVLAELAIDDPAARRRAIDDSPFGVLAGGDGPGSLRTRWRDRWTALCPPTSADEAAGLRALTGVLDRHLDAAHAPGAGPAERRDARVRLGTRAMQLVHRRTEEPVVVFCHLVLVALDLQRLRDGLLRRALFRAQPGEQAA